MKIKETLLSWKEKLKKIDVPKLLASRAFLVGGCVLLVAVTITVSALMGGFFEGEPPSEESESGKLLGNSVLVGDMNQNAGDLSGGDAPTTTEPTDLLAITVLNREAVREDAITVLRSIADNPDAMPDEKENALTQIDGGIDTLEDTREKTLKSADMTKILTMEMVANILTAQNFGTKVVLITTVTVDYLTEKSLLHDIERHHF